MSLGFALALSFVQAADEAPKFRDPPKCWDGSQHEMNVCAWKEYQQADQAMNQQWEKTASLMKRLDIDHPPIAEIGQSSHSEALLKGQKVWLQFRDAHCPIFSASGGSMAPMLRDLCLRDITKARTEQLKALMLNPATGNPYYEDQ